MKKKQKNLNSNIEKAFLYTEPADYTIQDVFFILKSPVVSHEYLEKASKELRLQSCLLLLNDSLPVQPSLLVRLAGVVKEDHEFKVKDQAHWDVFLKSLSIIQNMDDATLLGRLDEILADREDFTEKLSTLSKETDLPFSAENLSYCPHELGLSLTEKELINSDVYQHLTDFREILDRLSTLLLNGISKDEVKAGSGPVTLFSSLLSCNLSSFKKILRDKTESPDQVVGNQPLLFFSLNPILVKNNLKFFIALAKEVSSIPSRIYGESILSMILRFQTTAFNLKQALQICLEKGIVWSFEEWDKQFSSADFEKDQQNLSLLVQCQFQYSAEFDFDSYLKFLKKNILSPDVGRVSLAAAFVSADIVSRFDEEQRQQFFEGFSADRGITFPAIVFPRMLESGILDKELNEIDPERVAQSLLNVLNRWDEQVELDGDETPVIKHWVGLLKEHNVKHSDYAEILWILRQRKKQTETSSWRRKDVDDIAEVLNVFSKANSRDAFMHFAEKAFSFMNTSDDNDTLQQLSLEDFQTVIKNGLVDRLQLKDETLAKFLRYWSLDEFKKLSNGNPEPGDACLNAAASSGKKDILEFLLYDLKIPITGKRTARWSRNSADIVVNAALSGQDTILNFITKRYPNMISERDNDGFLPIHRAAKGRRNDDDEKPSEGKVHNCLAILCGKTDGHDIDPNLLNAPSSEGTPLTIALSNREPEIAQFLLKCGADVNACPLAKKGSAVLQTDNAKVLERLLDAGADIDVTDQEFDTVFTKFDFDPDSIPLFNKLLKKSKLSTLKQFNIDGCSVLSQLFDNIRSFQENTETRKLFLKTVETLVKKYHFDINSRIFTWSGLTPFLRAVSCDDVDIPMLKSLIKLGALPDKTSIDGKNAIIVAVDDAEIETVKFLVGELKLDINAKDDEGKNCLFYAIDKKDEVFAYLIRHGANVHVRDNEGKNLLWYALDRHEYAKFRNLIEEHHLDCAKPSVEDGNIIFQLVDAMKEDDDLSVSEFSDLLQLCLDNGANINSVRKRRRDNEHIVQYILSNITENEKSLEILKRILEVPGLKIPKKNSDGDTLLHLLSDNGEASAAKIASFLLEKGLVAVSVANNDGEWPLHIAAGNANIPLCDVLWRENPLGIHQPDNRHGYQPLQKLVFYKAENLDAIVRFVDTYGADPTAEDEDQNTILDTYLGESDSTIEGLRYLCGKGARVKHLNKFANKDISFFVEYVSIVFQGDCSKLISEFQLQQEDDAVIEILDRGNIELFRYLTDNGFKIWKHFSDTKWFEQLRISEVTAPWLRLFFIEWQWPVSYLTGDSPYLTYFLDHFDSDALPALQLLLDDLQLQANPQDLLEKISGDAYEYKSAVMAYLIRKGALPELCPAATSIYLRKFENQEIFSDFLDRLADNAENKNFDYEIPDPDNDEKMFRTTLLHQAAENSRNIFALRYLIEKRGLSPDGLRDSRNHTVLEHAAFSGSIKAVHYLLGRMEHIDQDLLNSLLVLFLEGDNHYSDDLVKLLVEVYHADPGAKNNFGKEAEALTDDERLKAYLSRCKKERAR